KYQELEKHRCKKSGSHVSDDVIEFCKTEGILREEFTLKSRFLLQNGLAFLGSITQQKLNDIYNERTQLQRLEGMKYENFNDLPLRLRSTYASWKLGLPINLKRTTFYRHRTELLSYGIDISIPNNVHYLPERVRTVQLKALTAPDWYIQNYG
ncbi:Phage X family protein, partial [Nitrosomonas eutropha]